VVTLRAPAEALSQLGWFVLTMVAGNLVLPLIILPLLLAIVVRTNPVTFFLNMSEALLVNFGTASSISTFPVTLACLTKKNKLSPTIASFALSLGVLINICSYPLLGLLYIGSVEGSPLTSGPYQRPLPAGQSFINNLTIKPDLAYNMMGTMSTIIR